MRIQHNIPAMSAYRNYTNNVSAVNKNLEKLSSGYRINRAGDDAAGLAISEKMRIQISGLEQAQSNAKSGINLVQTAEGALTEVHDMLNRMYTLAEQSANGTYSDEVDREQLQKEVNSLRTEINRIADATNYNGINLLDGSLDGSVTSSGAVDVTYENAFRDGQLGKEPQAGVFSLDMSNFLATNSGTTDWTGKTLTVLGSSLTLDDVAVGGSVDGASLAKQIATKYNAQDAAAKKLYGANVTAEAQGDKVIFTMDQAPNATWAKSAGVTSVLYSDSAKNNGAQEFGLSVVKEPVDSTQGRMYASAQFKLTSAMVADGKTITIGDETYVFAVGSDSKFKDGDNVIDLTDIQKATTDDELGMVGRRLSQAALNNKNFKVGSSFTDGTIYLTEREGGVDYTKNNLAGADNKYGDTMDSTAANWAGLVTTGTAKSKGKALSLQIGDTAEKFNKMNVSIKDMHADAMGIGEIDISTQEGASEAMAKIKGATNYVSDARGDLGALQNRLDHTIKNLSVTQENIQDAESTIRDVDIAKEMMAYTKNNILVQSAQAMLAQANQLPQGVLQLLG